MTFWDTSNTSVNGRAPYARTRRYTNLTSITITGTPRTEKVLLVYVNGVYNQELVYTGTSGVPEDKVVTLPAGIKKVEVVESSQGSVGIYCSCDAIVGGFNQVATAPSKRVVTVTDSIGMSYLLTQKNEGWNSLLRFSLDQAVWALSFAGRVGLKAQELAADTATLMTEITPLFDGTSKNVVFIDLGTNDYAGNRSAAQFTTDLTTIRAAIVLAFPAMNFVWSSPVSRTGEATPNGAGAVLADFRTAMSAFATLMSDTYNEGSTVLIDPTDLFVDGIHPNTSGHAKKATRAGTVMAGF
jgi:lysophospholipase L1-like esterase